MRRLLAGSILFLSGAAAWADVHEVTQSLTMVGGLGRSQNVTLDSGEGGTNFSFGASYYRLVHPQIQLGLNVDFFSAGNSSFDVLGGVRYNFGSRGWRNDFFINPSVGFVKTGGNDVKFAFDVGFGKRFSLLENVTYMPTFSFYYVGALRERFDFIRFSIVW